jgi:hypothetical protein
MVSFVQSDPRTFCCQTPNNSYAWIPFKLFLLGHSLGLYLFAILSMDYRVLLVVPIYLHNWLLVLPPKNGFNTCSVSIPVFWSLSIDLIWSSRLKIIVNSIIHLLQLRFMIPAVVHTWCDYGQNHVTPLPNSIRLRQFLERIYFRHTSSNFQHF